MYLYFLFFYDLPTVVPASIPILLLLLNSDDRRTLRQLQLEYTLIDVRKARYIYVYKQSEIDNIRGECTILCKNMSNSGISQGPIQSVRGGSGSGQVYAFAEYRRRVGWTALVDI